MIPSYIKYAQEVLEGKVVAGELVKLSCDRFFRFMEGDDYEFRSEEVEKVINFCADLKHSTGRHAGHSFILEPWEAFAVANIFGFYRKDDGTRLTKMAYLELARKNGKSALMSALALWGLIADGEMSAEVDFAANSKDQAKILFKLCKNFSRSLDPRSKYLTVYRDKILFDHTLSEINVFSADDSKLDGYNASLFCLDEFHAAPDQSLLDVLVSSQGMRESPLGLIITTAGFNKLGPCYQYRTMCAEILKGLKKDDSLFPLIYCLDENDDWTDEKVWVKANPNLGVTVRESYLREQVQKALNSPSNEVGVKTKNLNMWCDAEDVWIPDNYILDASEKLNMADFEGEDCWIGVDLAATSDLTAVAFMFIRDEIPYFFVHYYLPQAALREKRLALQYSEWKRAGALTITPGNVTDYDYITNDIMDVGKKTNIVSVAYDSWNAIGWAAQMEEQGMPLEPFSQALGNFNRSTREMERLLLSRRVKIDNNVITRHCFRNVVLSRDRNGNIKPSKQFNEKKIDGVISMLQALGTYFTSPRYGEFY